jgi:hypothetical protein
MDLNCLSFESNCQLTDDIFEILDSICLIPSFQNAGVLGESGSSIAAANVAWIDLNCLFSETHCQLADDCFEIFEQVYPLPVLMLGMKIFADSHKLVAGNS